MSSRRISMRKAVNLARIAGNRLLPITPALGYPYMVQVAPSGLCNLSCERCPVTDQAASQRARLPLETFQKLIDEVGEYLLYAILWSWGEPLLNRDIYKMIEYAHDRDVLTVTSSNMQDLSTQEAQELVASGLDALIIALDGATAETHERLRPGADYQRVVDNTKMVVEEKVRQGSSTPLLNLRMVVSRENESEVDAFRALAREIGVDMVSFKAYSTRQAGYGDQEWDEKRAPGESDLRWYDYGDDFTLDTHAAKRFNCRFLWTKPTLFADGQIAMCEFDVSSAHGMGNINEKSFDEIWFGDSARKMRERFVANRDDFEHCRECVFDYTQIDGCVLDWEYLSDAVRG